MRIIEVSVGARCASQEITNGTLTWIQRKVRADGAAEMHELIGVCSADLVKQGLQVVDTFIDRVSRVCEKLLKFNFALHYNY